MSQDNKGVYVPTTTTFDILQLQKTDVNSEDFKKLIVRLYQTVNNISIALNTKESGYYRLRECINSQLYFADPTLSSATATTPHFRNVYRTVVDTGALKNAGLVTMPHNLTLLSNITLTRLYGAATDPVAIRFLPIPYSDSAAGLALELYADNTNVYIKCLGNMAAYTKSVVVMEYLKE